MMPDATFPIRALCRRGLRALLVISCLALPAATLGPAEADAAGPQAADGAMEAFKAKHERVIKKVKKRASTASLQKELDTLLDYGWIARAALGGKAKYDQSCAPRCDEFEKLLTRLIRENYLRLIRKAEDHPVEYVNEIKGRKGAVRSRPASRS